ncbi:ester cyclase [Spirilliplanes yamanashiensis]|nr:ester cyclase [Spirilliplanes yamanashiensis]MDP9817700.1 putative ester cyclase [Spirilliplanes yamanashiensis]
MDIDALLAVWTDPVPADDAAAAAAFRRLYTDPVTVNGAPLAVGALVERARALQAAFSDRRTVLHDVVTAPGRLVVAFEMHVRHTGPLRTALGEVPATGRTVVSNAIDVLTLDADDRIAEVRVVSDELGVLTQLDAARLA